MKAGWFLVTPSVMKWCVGAAPKGHRHGEWPIICFGDSDEAQKLGKWLLVHQAKTNELAGKRHSLIAAVKLGPLCSNGLAPNRRPDSELLGIFEGD